MASLELRMETPPPFPLQRMQTAPIPVASDRRPSSGNIHPKTQSANLSAHASSSAQSAALMHSSAHTSSNYSIQSQSQGSSRSSDTTQGTAQSTLFPPPLPLSSLSSNASTLTAPSLGGAASGEVTATDNVMNTVADASSSLFQICVTLRQRLSVLQSVEDALQAEEQKADEDADPVSLLWRTFRLGEPLMNLYNALRPDKPLSVPATFSEEKRKKAATFKFLQACVTDLKFPQEECFIITDLYNTDTTGFVKVAKVVNRVLDILVQRGIIPDIRPTASDFEQAAKGMKRTQRQHIISELVTTERTYVQHLELLQAFKHLVEEKGALLGDAVHEIFLNLNALLDFQRRFLIRIEQTNHLPEEEQNWGKLFVLYCDAFKVYEPYIANQRKCEKTVVAHFDKLAAAAANASIEIRQMVESPTNLYGFLMKPFQRLSKYPLLLDDLYKKGDLDEERKRDLLYGREAATSVLATTNQAVDREEKAEAVQELKLRVEDWKGHRVESFGTLLLYGTFTVLKSEAMGAGGKEGERSYHVYLFETILLCCKDIDLSKPKNKLSNKQLVDRRGKPKLQLKGRIFMQNVTDLISLSKPGSYTCQIFWKGDPSIENFIIRFTTEEMMKKWYQAIEAQRRMFRERGDRTSDGHRSLGTSTTEFEYMRNQPLENPYAQQFAQDEEEDDDVDTLVGTAGYPASMKDSMDPSSRNGSFISLRSRGESVSSTATARTQTSHTSARYPPGAVPQPNLSLRTRELTGSGNSPVDLAGDSYFSPVDGSPSTIASSRTSASSGMYNAFPMALGQQLRAGQNGTPLSAYDEAQYQPNSSRFTAPAMARQREPSVVSMQQQPTSARGPPPRQGSGLHSATQMPGPPRNRSASSPDIHNQPRPPQPPPSSTMPPPPSLGMPPVPHMPAPYVQHPGLISRSQTNSPALPNGASIPPRGQNVSPLMQRERTSRGQPQQLQQQYQPISRTITPTPGTTLPPPPPPPPGSRIRPASGSPPPPQQQQQQQQQAAPTQLKVKVHCPSVSSTLTLVVPLNITYQSLKDRIDAKLQRSTNLSLQDRGASGGPGGQQQVKLKFADEGDFVSIVSDEDVQTAFESWSGGGWGGAGGGMGEVELFCTR